MEAEKKHGNKVSAYLHLGSTVLEPELDLARFQAQFMAQFQPLLIIWVRTFLEQTARVTLDMQQAMNKKLKP